MSAARMLDANLNRAREAARVVEDYCRLGLANGALSERLKLLRQDLAEAEQGLRSGRFHAHSQGNGGLESTAAGNDGDSQGTGLELLEARDIPADPGVSLTTPFEARRSSLRDIATANFRRLQEALRVLEETAKLAAPEIASRFKNMRYDVYDIEQATMMSGGRGILAQSSIMLILGEADCLRPFPEVVRAAYLEGIRCFQVREKEGSDRERLARATAAMEMIRQQGDTLVLINDRCDFCQALHADGVHLGDEDVTSNIARNVLGELPIIGKSTHDLDDVAAASHVDYLGAGAMYSSVTKNVTRMRGRDFGGKATAATSLPVFCIGGVTIDNARELRDAGARRVAVCSAICGVRDPGAAAAALLKVFPALSVTAR